MHWTGPKVETRTARTDRADEGLQPSTDERTVLTRNPSMVGSLRRIIEFFAKPENDNDSFTAAGPLCASGLEIVGLLAGCHSAAQL